MKKLILSLTIAGIVAGSAAAGTAFASPFTNPTDADCHGARVTSLVQGYGSLKKAADSLGISVKDLQKAIDETCAGGD
jgi:hypothetical protein